MNCSWVSHYHPIKVPFGTSHLAEGQAGLRPWVQMPGRQRCRWCRHAGCEWAGQSPSGPPRALPALRPAAAPSLMPLGPRKRFLCPHDTPQRRQAAPPAPAREGSGAARPPKQRSRGETITAPIQPSPPTEPGRGKDSEGIMARYLR